MCQYFCIGFIDFMLKGKNLHDYKNLFSFNAYKKNGKKDTKIFSITKKLKSLYCVICDKFRKFQKPKTSFPLEKTLVRPIICSKCKDEEEKIFKQEESIEVLNIFGLIESI